MKYFDKVHPVVAFTFFTVAISINMFATNFVHLFICFLSSLILRYLLKKEKIFYILVFTIGAIIVFTAVNMIFNSSSSTVLFTIFGFNITLSLLFGIKLSFLYISVINLFSCYSLIITSDKFIFLFGKIVPSTSLLFCMIMRFIPLYKRIINHMLCVSKCIGKGILKGQSKRKNIKNAMIILSAIMTSALENSIYTSQAMINRGYGLSGKTNFVIYKFRYSDKILLGFVILSLIGFILSAMAGISQLQVLFLLVMFVSPSIYILIEEKKWNILKSRI